MNVVDIGSCDWGESVSVAPLIERFHPEWLWGFDPYPNMGEGRWEQDGTNVVMTKMAAWTNYGQITIEPNGSSTTTAPGRGSVVVMCFDLADWLVKLEQKVILKLDCEGAEHVLLPHLIETGAIDTVELLLVEFHGDYKGLEILVPWEAWV